MSDRVKSSIPFINLHGHTTIGSPKDAIGFPQESMDYAYENGCDGIAVTDHGTMNALPYQLFHLDKMKAEGRGFKTYFGVEAYVIESLEEWRKDYATSKKEDEDKKKNKKEINPEDEDGTSFTEDELETKSKTKSKLNKRAHMVLLAQNQKGLNNLFWLISHSYAKENFYRFPRMDLKMLEEHSEGIIATSACLGGFLGRAVLDYQEEGLDVVYSEMKRINSKIHSIFGPRWFLEMEWNGIPAQHVLNALNIKLASETGVRLVSTCDSHYPRPELWKDREMYKKLAYLNRSSKDTPEDFWKLPESVEELKYELYPKNGDQMWESYKRYSKLCNVEYDDKVVLDSITESVNIAGMIEDFRPDTSIKLPKFIVPEGREADEYLSELAFAGLKEKKLDGKKNYIDRLEMELDTIKHRGFSKYFLTKKAICDEGRKIMSYAFGRGSAAGSLVSYLLKITAVDPIRFNLQFERFLSKNSTTYPDIDNDWSSPADLKAHLRELWGDYSVVPVTNFNLLKPRSLIKDISKFFDVPFQEVNEVTTKMLLEATPKAKEKNDIQTGAYDPTLEELVEFSPSLQNFFSKYPQIESYVANLSKQLRNFSQHAGGICVADNIDQHMPLISVKDKIQTPWAEGQNVRHLESCGFIKFDELGISVLLIIEGAIRRILTEKNGVEPSITEILDYYEKNFHPDNLNFNDQNVYENVFHQGKFLGIFQAAEGGMQQLILRSKPRSLEELSNVSAIFRPGPLAAHVDELYLTAKENPESVVYLHPSLKPVLSNTFGLVVFQEQISQVVHLLGKGITLDDGNEVRKLLTKRGIGPVKDKLLKYREKFIEGCKEKNIQEKTAVAIWDMLDRFSQYSFNLSHSLSYAMISYTCAYLLHYHAKHWCCAFLDNEPEDKKEKAIGLVRSLGFDIRPVDINKSQVSWTALDDYTLIQPLISIKGLGEVAIEQILNNRPFDKIEDLLYNDNIKYSKLNKRGLDCLCRAEALKPLQDSRFTGDKHFWSCVAVDKPKTLKLFEETIQKYAPEKNFSRDERVENIVSLTGRFPMELVLTPNIQKELDRYKIPGISNFDGELGYCWFVVRAAEPRTTRNGKPYLQMSVIDDNNQLLTLRIWSWQPDKDKICLNRIYICKPDWNETYGFGLRSYPLDRKLKLLG